MPLTNSTSPAQNLGHSRASITGAYTGSVPQREAVPGLSDLGHSRASISRTYTGSAPQREVGPSRSALSIARQFGHNRSMVSVAYLGQFHTVSGASRAVRHDVLRRQDLDDDYSPQ